MSQVSAADFRGREKGREGSHERSLESGWANRTFSGGSHRDSNLGHATVKSSAGLYRLSPRVPAKMEAKVDSK